MGYQLEKFAKEIEGVKEHLVWSAAALAIRLS